MGWTFDPLDYQVFREKCWPKIDAIEGYLSCLEAFFLYQTAKSLKGEGRGVDQPKGRAVVEIGSFKGRSTAAIGLGLQHNPYQKFSLYCVDPFFENAALQNEFLTNMKKLGLDQSLTMISDYASTASKKWKLSEGIFFLWIDGNHEFEHVQADFLSWSPFLVSQGMIAFHDWYLVGVQSALKQYVFTHDSYQDAIVVDHNLVAFKKVDGSPSRQQKAQKKRTYWALRTGSTSLALALLAMIYDLLNKPFGHIKSFFRANLDIQKG